MDFKNAITETVSGMFGKVEKAVIKVVDNGESDEDEELVLFAADDSGNAKNALGTLDMAYGSVASIKKKAIETLANKYADALSAFDEAKQFTVQFNPATLQLRASGGGKTELRNFTKSAEQGDDKRTLSCSYAAIPFSIYMDVDLVFNKVDPNDAFIELAPSLGTIKGAVNSVRNLLGKNASYSVQNEIEGLIATTRCFNTCLLSFNWGKLCYSGVLQSLDANYTVFNPKGEPVAGTVHMSMVLIDSGINERNMGKWYEAYQRAFQDNTSGTSIASKLGSSAFTNFTF